MRVWTVANQKGGVGKTTTAINIAGILVQRGKRVLLVDIDPHASLGYYLGLDCEQVPGSLYDLFSSEEQLTSAKVSQHIVPTNLPKLDLLPATMALATLDQSLGQQQGMGLILKNILSKVNADYDFVIIDCPPVLGVLMINALAACEHIIVPVQTDFLAIKGLDRMIKTILLMEQSKSMRLSYTIVPTMFDKRTKASTTALKQLLDNYAEYVWGDVIPVDTKLRDASGYQLPPSHCSPRCRGNKSYKKLVKYLLAKDMSYE